MPQATVTQKERASRQRHPNRWHSLATRREPFFGDVETLADAVTLTDVVLGSRPQLERAVLDVYVDERNVHRDRRRRRRRR